MAVYSNIVKKDRLRVIQKEVLEEIKNALIPSYGPYASNTMIFNSSTDNTYTKDGHQILSSIKILNEIESSIQRDLLDITYNIVRKVGDGTTSATILSTEIFKHLLEIEDEYTPYELMRTFDKTVKLISEEILKNKVEFTPEMAYKISMISTNGNEEISSQLKTIYEKYGKDVYINVTVTTQDKNTIKIYDGLSMKEGVYSSVYMNMPEENKAVLRNAYVYYFDDPIDTPEMIALFDAIIQNNIFTVKEKEKLKPTVILAPHISRDMSTYIENIEATMGQYKGMSKPPLIIINNIFKNGNIDDIVKMCGCKPIKKYIDFNQQKEDIEKGLAPNVKTVSDFGGFVGEIVCTSTESKFINPKNMVVMNNEGVITGYSDEYYALINYLENEIERAKDDGEDANKIGGLRRRLNSLKANMIDYIIGGISLQDREALKCLVEDAVLNCRSAAEYGVGFGANFEGLNASEKIYKQNEFIDKKISNMAKVIFDAYTVCISILYGSMDISLEEIIKILDGKAPVNMRNYEINAADLIKDREESTVLSSIMTDVVILESISKLLTLLFTCNQFIVSEPLKNVYNNPDYMKK